MESQSRWKINEKRMLDFVLKNDDNDENHYQLQRKFGWFSNRFSMIFVKRDAWLGDVKIRAFYSFLQCLLPVGLFTQSKHIRILSSTGGCFFREGGRHHFFLSILGTKVIQKWIDNIAWILIRSRPPTRPQNDSEMEPKSSNSGIKKRIDFL